MIHVVISSIAAIIVCEKGQQGAQASFLWQRTWNSQLTSGVIRYHEAIIVSEKVRIWAQTWQFPRTLTVATQLEQHVICFIAATSACEHTAALGEKALAWPPGMWRSQLAPDVRIPCCHHRLRSGPPIGPGFGVGAETHVVHMLLLSRLDPDVVSKRAAIRVRDKGCSVGSGLELLQLSRRH